MDKEAERRRRERLKRFRERLKKRLGNRRSGGRGWSALQHANNEQRPVISKLLAVPAWRARYLAHIHTVVHEWLDWAKIGPEAEAYQRLIQPIVKTDTRRLYDYDGFAKSLEPEGRNSIRGFFEQRRKALLSDDALKGPWPTIESVEPKVKVRDGGARLTIVARASKAVPVGTVLLYYAGARHRIYRTVTLHDDGAHGDGAAGDGVFGGTTPPLTGDAVFFYVEARSADGAKTCFSPSKAESGPRQSRWQ